LKLQPFEDIGGEFKARLREIATTTRSTVDNSTVTFRTARIDCEYTPKVIKHLAMGQLVAIPNVQALGTNSSYSLYEIADVYPMHYSMLTLDRSQPAAIRTEFMDLIQKEWEKGSKSTWIEVVAAPIGYVMRTTEDGISYERRAMAPLTGSQVRLLSRESIEQLICFKPPQGNADDYSLGKLLGFTDGSIPFSVNLEQLIHYMSGTFAFSLDHDEPIVFRQDGKIGIGKIGELVDQFFHDQDADGRVYTSALDVLSFDKDSFEVRWSPLRYVFRHRYHGKLLRFHARTGRNVTVTPGHSLFVLRSGRIQCLPSNNLKRGDLLVGSRTLPSQPESYQVLDLVEFCKSIDGDGIMLSGIPANAPEAVDSSIPKRKGRRGKSLGVRPLSDWHPLRQASSDGIRIVYKGCPGPLPPTLTFDEEFARLLGYYAANGRILLRPGLNHSIQFTLSRTKGRAILDDLRTILRAKFGVKLKVRSHGEKALRASFNHRILAQLISGMAGRGAQSKRVPPPIFNSPSTVRRAFLGALAAGDHGVAVSKGLMNDVMYLLLLDDTVGTATEWKRDGSGKLVDGTLRLHPRYQMHSPNANEVAAGTARTRGGRADPSLLVPGLSPSLRMCLPNPSANGKKQSRFTGREPERDDGRYLARESGRLSAQLLFEVTEGSGNARQLANSTLVFYEIDRIEEVEATGKFVYDVSVPGDENFLAGFGGVFCHNTGSGKSNLTATVVRKALRAVPDLKVVIFDVSAEYGIHILDVLNRLPSRVLFTDSFKGSKSPEAEYFKRHATPETLAGREKDFYSKISELFSAGKVEFLQTRMVGEEDAARFSTYEGLVEVLSNTLNEKYGPVQQKILVPQVIEIIKQFLLENKLDIEARFDSQTAGLIGRIQPLLADLPANSALKKAFDSLAKVVESIPERAHGEEGYTWNRLAEEILSTSKDSPRVFVVNLPEAEDARLETANVINEVFRRRKHSFTLSPRVLFIIDEAQEFIPQNTRKEDGTDQSSRALERLLRHGRKYHLHCWVSTQRVAHLNTNALQQLHSYFVSTMPRPYDRQLISDTFAIDDAFMERTLAFQNGDWLLTSFKATATQNIPVFFHADNNEEILDAYLKRPLQQ
jgi:intein/homing endonuclease